MTPKPLDVQLRVSHARACNWPLLGVGAREFSRDELDIYVWSRKVVVFDLDDTLSDTSHRQHFFQDAANEKRDMDWDGYFAQSIQDAPLVPMLDLFQAECEWARFKQDRDVHVWTGRSERVMGATVRWMRNYVGRQHPYVLVMRPDGDHSRHTDLKLGWLKKLSGGGGRVIRAYDDSNAMVGAWRGAGVCCLQPERNDY